MASMNYTIGAAARSLGVSEARLRNWERRYGVPCPARSESGRRLYSEAEMAMLHRMAAYLAAGFPAAQAAEAAQRESESALAPALRLEPALNPLATELFAAAGRLDAAAVSEMVARAAGEAGWEAALPTIIFPALVFVGRAWERGELAAAHEHLLSECVRSELMASIVRVPRPGPGQPLVLLACPEEERHEVGLLALRLFLLEESLRVLYLGTDLPLDALVDAVAATRPAAVCLAATTGAAAPSMARAARVLVRRGVTNLFVGGPAALLAEAPGRMLSHDIRAAARQVAAALSARAAAG